MTKDEYFKFQDEAIGTYDKMQKEICFSSNLDDEALELLKQEAYDYLYCEMMIVVDRHGRKLDYDEYIELMEYIELAEE